MADQRSALDVDHIQLPSHGKALDQHKIRVKRVCCNVEPDACLLDRRVAMLIVLFNS